MPNEKIENCIQNNYGKVTAIIKKRLRDGLTSGIRIVTKTKCDFEWKPMLSYKTIDGYELYVMYSRQNLTCRYCSKVGHPI